MKALKLASDKLLGLFFLILALFYLLSCKGLLLGTFNSPEEGFVPVIIGTLLAIFSIILLLRDKKKDNDAETPMERDAILRIIKIAVAILAYVILISAVGFKISTVLVLMVTARFLGNTNWKINCLFGIVSAIFAAVLFQVWLQLPLPEPLFDFIFGL